MSAWRPDVTTDAVTERRDQVARGAEIGGTAVAGTVGTALAATKLRDAYKEDYGREFARGASRARRAAVKVAPKSGGRLARLISHGKPGFVPLAALTVGAGAAAGARHYRQHREKAAAARRPLVKGASMGTSAFGVEHELSKADRNDSPVLDTAAELDTTVRRVRRRVAPSGLRIAAKVADERTRLAVQRDRLNKAAYDPETAARRRERVAEGALGAGAVASGVGAVQHGRSARRHFQASAAHARSRDKQLHRSLRANDAAEQSAGTIARAAANKGVTRAAKTALHADIAHAGVRQVEGMRSHTAALHASQEAKGALRHVRTFGLGAAGLGTGAYLMHRRASDHDR